MTHGLNLKVAVVTGAGSGIGRRTALAFLEEGYAVTLVGRRREPLETTAADACAAASRALVVPADVGDPGAVRSLFSKTRENFGRVDVLFNNAGIFGPSGPFEDIPIGNTATDMVKAILQDGAGATQADGSRAVEPTLDLDHVARAVIHMASLPLEANIQFMTIMATTMPFIGRG
ncbi:MAG: SDR family oxidoreductase [Deltaproteobacteria bacterium]|nr:SDR family oxidoreductase [Deltaproteobacteria bacterium]